MSRKKIKKKVSKAKAMKELRRQIHKSIVEADETAKPIDTPDKMSAEEKQEIMDDFCDVT